MAALEAINYLLRPNKNIERKLIFGALRLLVEAFPLRDYRYVGLGSLWFADFMLAYRTLQIEEMVAIERRQWARRVEYNRPFRTVKVEPGDSTKVLPKLGLRKRRAIVWMDYENGLDRGEALPDIDILCRDLPAGSIAIITVNAHPPPTDKHKSYADALGDFIPATRPSDYFDRSQFPKKVGAALGNALQHSTRKSGRSERFLEMFNFVYKDGAPMVTVGGMIASGTDEKLIKKCDDFLALNYVQPRTQFAVAAPPLTVREKLALDQLLPASKPPTIQDIRDLGFDLKKEQIEAYYKFHLHYPLFGEFAH